MTSSPEKSAKERNGSKIVESSETKTSSFVGQEAPFSKLPPRRRDGHKGDYGTATILGGSRGMGGAALLAGQSALLAGAGLVRLLLPEGIRGEMATARAELMTVGLPEDAAGRIALDASPEIFDRIAGKGSPKNGTVGFGPGLGQSLGLEVLASRLFFTVPGPITVDADALNLLAAREVFLKPENRVLFPLPPVPLSPRGPRILTPHPGEFARLRHVPTPISPEERKSAAIEFVRTCAELFGFSALDPPKGERFAPGSFPTRPTPLVLVLKGAGTVVTDGTRTVVNSTGNPGMATGGSGDVLTGIITGLLSQRLDPFDAASLGVWIHGRSGDLAADALGEESVTASDLLRFLPEAIRESREVKIAKTE